MESGSYPTRGGVALTNIFSTLISLLPDVLECT